MGRARIKFILLAASMLVIFLILILTYVKHSESIRSWEKQKLSYETSATMSGFINNEVYITVVACGTRVEETLTMIKSALIFNKMTTFLNFKIIAEDILKRSFKDQLIQWQKILADKFSFQIYSLNFPKTDEKDWRSLFKPCAAQRLFLPSLLHNVDATIYVDTDIVFLSPATDLWNHFKYFNMSHIAGLSPEHEDVSIGWYNRFARHPYFGKLGVNSGVMLMNLTRMRKFEWETRILPLHKQYRSQITWGDQDLINIIFYYHPDKLYIFPCIYNYRPDHCMYMNVCNITNGVRILHGNRGYFHSNKQPLFKKVYEACRDFEMDNVSTRFSYRLSEILENLSVKNSSCGKVINQVGWFGTNLSEKEKLPNYTKRLALHL